MAKPENSTRESGVTGISDDDQFTNSRKPSLRGTRILKWVALAVCAVGKLGEKMARTTTRAAMMSMGACMMGGEDDA